MNPTHILLIKSHSMGIGDLLRSSAAWRALRDRWPQVQLHVLMLSRHPGYPTEQLIGEHHLLASAHFVSVNAAAMHGEGSQRLSTNKLRESIAQSLRDIPIDLIIDCEPHGLRTTMLSRWLSKRYSAPTAGVAQFALRGWLYDHAAPSVKNYARQNQLNLPLDYTERDFLALAALGITRDRRNIELAMSWAGKKWQETHLPTQVPGLKITLNIGCGTPDALSKRPNLKALNDCMVALFQAMPFTLYLSGADFECIENQKFAQIFLSSLQELGLNCNLTDFAGQSSLSELTGLLAYSDLVISSDSGPYHMAVGLGIPTLCWFNFETSPSCHPYARTQALVLPQPDDFVAAAKALLQVA